MGCRILSSGSVLGAALSLAVTTMGAGILTLPSAYADAGIIPATLVLIGVAVFTVFSVDFIILGVDKLGRNSYEELTRELLGKRMEEVVRWMLIVYNFGAAISYLVVVEDLVAPLQPLVTNHFPLLTTPKHTLLTLWSLLILPLSCVPTLGALHFSSFLAISATSLICCMIVFRYFVPGPTAPSAMTVEAVANGTTSASWWWGINPLLALPIIMFSFDCQSLVFQIYAGLDDMRRSNMMKVSTISLIVTGVIHASVGFFGYLSNPADVRENIISNYDPKVDSLFTVGYILYAAPIILAFVLLLFPIRDSIFILWFGYSSASAATHVPRSKDFVRLVNQEESLELLSRAEDEAGAALKKTYGSVEEELQHVIDAKKHHNDIETIPPRDHLIISVTLSTLCVTVALIVPGIVSVVSLLGGLCSSTLCFLVPGLYRWQMHYKNIARCHNNSEWCIMTMMVILGVVAAVLGTVVSIQDVFFAR
ncbi:amino acid permease-like protein (AAT26) [Leptomonas seymouri]|uniref:Amino acid permease-like protein (AAT26) n=1 Tax=Leptomonas seymouri TaxID=5684 RepID=A0A0N1IJ81_LEPSE|nr:amino acid permease-like protein (AAT26) [Leptomonas seymouri]|eukprot:KPI85440.1 amino acid permease-like protein (AAT26) [Leptomonas seymouri]